MPKLVVYISPLSRVMVCVVRGVVGRQWLAFCSVIQTLQTRQLCLCECVD